MEVAEKTRTTEDDQWGVWGTEKLAEERCRSSRWDLFSGANKPANDQLIIAYGSLNLNGHVPSALNESLAPSSVKWALIGGVPG